MFSIDHCIRSTVTTSCDGMFTYIATYLVLHLYLLFKSLSRPFRKGGVCRPTLRDAISCRKVRDHSVVQPRVSKQDHDTIVSLAVLFLRFQPKASTLKYRMQHQLWKALLLSHKIKAATRETDPLLKNRCVISG